VLLARFFVEILTRFAGSKVWTPACQCAIFFAVIRGHKFLQAVRLKKLLACCGAVFCGDSGPRCLQAVRLKDLLTCCYAIFWGKFGPAISAGSTV
jgi:hypothetical protein